MTITTNTDGTTAINADSGMALRRKTDKGPTRITRVALASWDSPDSWADCEYAQTEEESAAHVIPASRTFDKYRLVDALITAGVWDHVEAWLKETPYAWLRVQMAPDISEDEPLLAQGIAAVKQLLGWTDEQVEAVLAASVKEGY